MSSSESSLRPYSRREFMTRAGLAGFAASWANRVRGAGAQATGATGPSAGGDLRAAFLEPPESARPMTRWWWFGGAITPEEITRELQVMHEAGIRGVELQPVYPLETDDPRRGIRNTRYFSAEFNELLRHTVRETRRLGMQFDLTLGSGWPFGGPFVSEERAARCLHVLTRTLVGPGHLSWDLTPEMRREENEKPVAILATPLLPSGEPDLAHSRVLTNPLQTKMEDDTPIGLTLESEIPPGLWNFQVFLDSPTLMQVKRPTLGMEGLVIDHHNRESMDFFLDAAGDRVINPLKQAADPPLHSVFCDSLEVYGADWTSHFMEEFKRRRGYDFTPYLPALCREAGPLTPHLRYDYHLTMSDLIVENFFERLTRWAKERGLTARIQAHGAFGDVMQGYAAADIPEGEDISQGLHYSVNLKHRRLCTSAAHIYRKRLVSAETYTWLDMPLFTATLEEMKAATDTMFLEGINHIVNSGYSSSPPQVGKPGWVFYAETDVSENNVWWPHYHYLADYVQRVQSLLRRGAAVNPVAVYLPLPDVYAKFGSGSLHMDEEIQRHLGLEPFLALRRAGYDFDLINDASLAGVARVEGRKLRAGDAVYSAAVIPVARWMPPESLQRFAEFARAGGLLIFVERLPEGAPGLAAQEERTAEVRRALAALGGGRPPVMGQELQAEKGRVMLVADYPSALSRMESLLPPDFRILEARNGSEDALKFAQANVGFTHRWVDPEDVYFVSNVSGKPLDLCARFGAGGRPQLWDPETRQIHETLVFRPVELPAGGQATEVKFHLEPFSACFVVFAPGGGEPMVTDTNWPGPLQLRKVGNRVEASGLVAANGHYFLVRASGKKHAFAVDNVPQARAIEGTWEVEFDGGPKLSWEALGSWNDLPATKNYSGWATYRIGFEIAELDEGLEWWLDLGRVHETAEASLNGVALGAAWKGARRLNCTRALKSGQNLLVVRVGNLWVNDYYARPKPDRKAVEETFGIRWGTYGEVPPRTIPSSGLLGPVRLVPLRRRTEKI